MGIEIFAANLEWLMIALFVLGTILIAIELVVPGFGIAGILGIISLILGVKIAADVVAPAILVVMIAVILIVIAFLVIWFYRSMTKGGRLSKTLVLESKLEDGDGYVAPKDHGILLDKRGKTLTMLRPAGTAEFDGEKVDVITEGEFIGSGKKIEVIKVEGFKVVVREVEDHS